MQNLQTVTIEMVRCERCNNMVPILSAKINRIWLVPSTGQDRQRGILCHLRYDAVCEGCCTRNSQDQPMI